MILTIVILALLTVLNEAALWGPDDAVAAPYRHANND